MQRPDAPSPRERTLEIPDPFPGADGLMLEVERCRKHEVPIALELDDLALGLGCDVRHAR